MRHVTKYSSFLLESTDPEHTKPAKYFNEGSWKKALDSAADDLKSIKKILDKIAGDLSKRYPNIKWDVVASTSAYTGVQFGYDLTMKLPGWSTKRFISMCVCFKSRKVHDFDNAMSVDGLHEKSPYKLDVYYYKKVESYGEMTHDNNPTKTESGSKPYTLKQVMSTIADMDEEFTLLEEKGIRESKKIKDLDKYLTSSTGLDAEARKMWRDDIAKFMDKAEKEKDEAKKKSMKEEAFRVFQSYSYWRENYQAKRKK